MHCVSLNCYIFYTSLHVERVELEDCESERSLVPVLLGNPFILQIQKLKWETSFLSCWKFSTRSRRLADKQPCLLQLLVARPRSSLRLEPLLHLPWCLLHHPRQLGVAIVHGCYCDESTDDFDNICGVCYCDNVGEISSDLYRYHGVTF